MEFTIRGTKLEITQDDVMRVAKQVNIVADSKTRYMVIVDGKRYPAKGLFHATLKSKGYDLTLQDITTGDAVHVLRKLGFEIVVK